MNRIGRLAASLAVSVTTLAAQPRPDVHALARTALAQIDLRLLCPAHNQYEADRTFGAGFMAGKRGQVRKPSAALAGNVHAQSGTQVPEPEISTVPEQVDGNEAATKPSPHDPDHTVPATQHDEVVCCLRSLKFKLEEARYGATLCDHVVGQPLEVCVKHALKQLTRARFERWTVRPSAASAVNG